MDMVGAGEVAGLWAGEVVSITHIITVAGTEAGEAIHIMEVAIGAPTLTTIAGDIIHGVMVDIMATQVIMPVHQDPCLYVQAHGIK